MKFFKGWKKFFKAEELLQKLERNYSPKMAKNTPK